MDCQFAPTFSSVANRENFQYLMSLKSPKMLNADAGHKLYKEELKNSVKILEAEQVVQGVVHGIVKDLRREFKRSSKDEAVVKFFRKVFFKRFVHLSERQFDRSEISSEILKVLFPKTWKAQKKLKTLRSRMTPLTVVSDKKYYRAAVKTIKMALKLGIEPEPVAKGVSGTYFLKGLSGEKLGVFKPCDEEALSENSTSRLGKFRHISGEFPLFNTLIFLQGGNGCKSECMASIVSAMLKIHNVPITKMVTLKSQKFRYLKNKERRKRGSLQLYVPDIVSAGIAFHLKRSWCFMQSLGRARLRRPETKKHVLRQISQEHFEDMSILDFLCAQLDRHPENWLVGERIYLIDNGASMPHKHSDSLVSRLNQYIWRIFPHADNPFSDHALAVIDLLEEILDEIIAKLERKDLIASPSQIVKFRERARVLIHFVREGKTPYDLSLIRSTADFKKTLPECVKN